MGRTSSVDLSILRQARGFIGLFCPHSIPQSRATVFQSEWAYSPAEFRCLSFSCCQDYRYWSFFHTICSHRGLAHNRSSRISSLWKVGLTANSICWELEWEEDSKWVVILSEGKLHRIGFSEIEILWKVRNLFGRVFRWPWFFPHLIKGGSCVWIELAWWSWLLWYLCRSDNLAIGKEKATFQWDFWGRSLYPWCWPFLEYLPLQMASLGMALDYLVDWQSGFWKVTDYEFHQICRPVFTKRTFAYFCLTFGSDRLGCTDWPVGLLL